MSTTNQSKPKRVSGNAVKFGGRNIIGASSLSGFFIKMKRIRSWLRADSITDDLPEVDAWRREAGKPPLTPSMLKTFREEVDDLFASSAFPQRDIVDRPGRSGRRYVLPQGVRHAEPGAPKPELGFRRLSVEFAREGAFETHFDTISAAPMNAALMALMCLPGAAALQQYAPLPDNPGAWLWGSTGSGKTTILRAVASFVGHPVKAVTTFDAALSDPEKAMRSRAGSILLLDEARALIGTGGRKGGSDAISFLQSLHSGTVAHDFCRPRQEPFQFAWVAASVQPLPDFLSGLPYEQAVAQMNRVMTFPLDQFPLSTPEADQLNRQLLHAYGRPMSRFVKQLVRRSGRNSDKLMSGIERRQDNFRNLAAHFTRDGCGARIIDLFGRLHVVGSLAASCGVLPKRFADPDFVIRCLEAHRHALSPLSPLEQLLALASDPNIIDLRQGNRRLLTDEEVDEALFIRAHGGHNQLVLSRTKFSKSFPCPSLVESDPAVRRLRECDADHQTMQVRVRSNSHHDRMMCFRLPALG